MEIIAKSDEELGQSLPKLPYEYQRLRHAKEFRLLKIKPNTYEVPVECEIFHSNIDEKPEFEAISYTWADASGDNTLSRHVKVSSQDYVCATANCEAALKRVRDSHRMRIVWIDAICRPLHRIPLVPAHDT
jgi:hypothetical protein